MSPAFSENACGKISPVTIMHIIPIIESVRVFML
jgi:hypothetical protein